MEGNQVTDKMMSLCAKTTGEHLNVGFKMLLFIPRRMKVNRNWVLLILLQLLWLSFCPPIFKLKRSLLARSLAI